MWLLVVLGVATNAWLIRMMLHAVAGRGGESDGDAAVAAGMIIAQAQAYRVDRTEGPEVWDGVERLKGMQGNDGAWAG